jgi:hypothetical protein
MYKIFEGQSHQADNSHNRRQNNHRIGREKTLEFAVKLSRKSLVVLDDQSGFLDSLNDFRHGKGLPRTRNPLERGVPLSPSYGSSQGVDGLRLVTRRAIGSDDFEWLHFLRSDSVMLALIFLDPR